MLPGATSCPEALLCAEIALQSLSLAKDFSDDVRVVRTEDYWSAAPQLGERRVPNL